METLILAVVLFAVMIFPHELGHFMAARAVGVQVNEFAFGMGPALWKKEKNGTLYAIRAFPIGGYCAMEGEDETSDNPKSFNNKKPLQKFFVLVAGATMNLLICIVLLMLLFTVSGMTTTTVSKVTSNRPAYTAGIRPGDRITSVGDKSIRSWTDIGPEIASSKGDSVNVTVNRNGSMKTFSVKAEKHSGRYIIGIEPKMSHNPIKAVGASILATGQATVSIFKTLGGLITGAIGVNKLSGPVGIVSAVHQSVSYGLSYYVMLLALINLNLAIANLLPLPALDGGRILFLLVRQIGRDRITDDMEGTVHFIGFMLLMALTVFVTFNDIKNLF